MATGSRTGSQDPGTSQTLPDLREREWIVDWFPLVPKIREPVKPTGSQDREPETARYVRRSALYYRASHARAARATPSEGETPPRRDSHALSPLRGAREQRMERRKAEGMAFGAVRGKAKKIVNRKRYAERQLEEARQTIMECDAMLADLKAENPEWSGKIWGENGWTDAG